MRTSVGRSRLGMDGETFGDAQCFLASMSASCQEPPQQRLVYVVWFGCIDGCDGEE